MSNSNYRHILKSSALIGGSSAVRVLLGIVRTKALAVMIGAEGVGMFGALNSVTTVVSSIAGMGINTSGVRQIAEAVGSNDSNRIARTILTLRRASFFLGLTGMLGMMLLSYPISKVTFGDGKHAGALMLLSVSVFFTAVAAGQTALIQGLRQIKDLAALGVWGAVLGTLFSIPIVYFFRQDGIVPFLVVVSGLAIATSWWYARKVQVEKISLPWSSMWVEVKVLLGMGFVFMSAGLVASATAYLTQVLIIRSLGFEAAGLFQSAYTLSGVYVGFVLASMSADYYPRLTAVASDNQEVNRMVNEQTEAALMMSMPGILGTLTFAPIVINLFYSVEFEPAVEVLRWQVLGILGRVICWPIGFVLLAKGCGKKFFCVELTSNVVYLLLIWLGMNWFGLRGLGMAFFCLYVFGISLTLFLVQRESGFQWTPDIRRLCINAWLITGLVFFITSGVMPGEWGTVAGTVMAGLCCVYCARRLILRAGFGNLGDALSGITKCIGKKKS